jgi:DNA-binding response OmpR family regulator
MGVISDMRTPGGVSGADVHAWIRANRPELSRRILFITGDTVNRETMDILEKTGAPCIEKPFRVAQLLRSIETLMAGGAR